MVPFLRWLVAASALLTPLVAAAQRGLVIAGGVYEDRPALAERADFLPLRGVTVKLYRDGGSRTPDASAALVTTAVTDDAGLYVFTVDRPGDYWVVADSRTAGSGDVWAEQTFGPAGSLCAQPDGSSRTNWFEGPCMSGRSLASDDAATLATSEHLALVSLREPATRIDFAFSFNIVTTHRDGEAVQGSLRSFLRNAAAVEGPNRMRFVPLERAAERRDTTFGVPPRWWIISLESALPHLSDHDTVIDGTAHNFLSPASVMNIHPGRIGEAATFRPDESVIPRLEKPELEIVLAGDEGIVCTQRCGIRAVAIHGARTAISARADVRLEHVLVGATPDGIPADVRGEVGLEVEAGSVFARHLLVTQQSRAGLLVGPGAHLDGERLEITRCGTSESGAAVVLLSDGSAIRSSSISANQGAGIILGSLDGEAPAHANTIDGSVISGNQAGVILSPGASRNVITRNDIMWNRLGGITIAPFREAPPRENRLSANRFDENGLRPIVLDLDRERPDELALPGERCERVTSAPASGIAPPRLTSVRVVQSGAEARAVIQGRACPGEIVEIYQSFVTSSLRDQKQAELPRIRGSERGGETLVNQERVLGLPSIGEFNYLGATHAGDDGFFEATYPIPVIQRSSPGQQERDQTNVWASEVLRSADDSARAYSAIAIDADGNTSEMSVRRRVD